MRISRHKPANQQGYILLSIMLLMTLMLLALTVEAPRVAQQIKREKEEELIHRGNEYRNAIKKYFRKFGQYPVSIDQLVNTNNMHFLRKRYKDPFTGKDDWRLLHVGEVQVNLVNGGTNMAQGLGQPIGQPLGGPAGQPMGAAAGASSPGGTPSGAMGINPAPGQPAGDQSSNANAGGASPSGTPGGVTVSPSNTGFLGGSSGQFGGGPIIGVASTSKLKSIKVINDKDHYNDWPFYYDPRQEQVALGAGGAAGTPIGTSNGAPGMIQAPGSQQMGQPGIGQQGPIFQQPGPVTSPSTPH
jgi:type II secretory pathway pseudopilin PulG